ncbi:MAG: hypothetical protein MUC36_22315 [Planctomycetes bacterium]|jgi:hypothetical protein|nr:hypothetical protein [Planctomycetota bacterium]
MHTRHLLLLAIPLSLATGLAAQVQTNDVGMVGFSTNAFGIATGGTVTPYTTAGFQGTSAATSQSILHDPLAPNDFIVGGFGFVGRATITGPGAVNYTLITNGINTAAQMSWDFVGNIVVADAGTDQVRQVTLGGVVTDLSTGAQPWGTSVNAGAYQATTGDVIVGGNGGLFRLAVGTTTGVPIATGLGGFVSWITFDPCNGDILAAVLTANRLIRVDSAGNVTDLAPPGTVAGPNALDIDRDGNLLVGGTAGRLFRVDYDGTATLVATNASPTTNVAGLAVAKASGFAMPFGTRCNATSGLATLSATGPYAAGAPFSTTSIRHAPSSIGLWIAGLSNTSYNGLPLPLSLDALLGTSGCFLNVSADVTVVALADAAGTMTFPLTAPASFAGQRLFVQHTALEPVPGGFSFSNGVCLQF